MMPHFYFVAVSIDNEHHRGFLEADSPDAALRELNRRNWIVIALQPRSRLASVWVSLNRDISMTPAFRRAELATLTREWGTLIDAGITVEEALRLSLAGMSRSHVRALIAAVREDVKGGTPLHDALVRHESAFPKTYVMFVRAAEASGTLGPALLRLASDLEMQCSVAAEIRQSLLYPAFLLTTATIAIVILLSIVVPNLEELFNERSIADLPLATRLVIGASHVMRDYGWLLLLSAVLLVGGTIAATWTERGKNFLDRIALGLPLSARIIRSLETGRLMRSFSALAAGGVPIGISMPLAVDTVRNTVIRQKLEAAYKAIITGTSISDALADSGVFPADAIGLVRVGERTGRLEAAMARIGALHDERARRALKGLTNLITPLLTVFFGLLTGLIVYAMLSTILSINELAN